jgi:hypothetical protein
VGRPRAIPPQSSNNAPALWDSYTCAWFGNQEACDVRAWWKIKSGQKVSLKPLLVRMWPVSSLSGMN